MPTAHREKHLSIIPTRVIYLCPFYFSWKDTTKEKTPTTDLCAASPVESVGVLHVRQFKDRYSKNFNLKMPQESFKLHFPEHAVGGDPLPCAIIPINI